MTNTFKLRLQQPHGSKDARIVVAESGEDIGRVEGSQILYPEKVAAGIVRAVNTRPGLLSSLNDMREKLELFTGHIDETKPVVQHTDLRPLSRYPELCVTTVSFDDRDRAEWLVVGQSEIRSWERQKRYGLWAYLKGATDFEHDSAYILRLPLIGLGLYTSHYHINTFEAWIDPDDQGLGSDFHVPRPGYNPLEKATKCRDSHCRRKDPHVIVPEGLYVPPFDRELFEAVRGRRVIISMGPVYPKEEE